MVNKLANISKDILDKQGKHWESTFNRKPDIFGKNPSEPAISASELLKSEEKNYILELGAGQGRDTLFFAQRGFKVNALDYSTKSLDTIKEKAAESGLSDKINTKYHDIRKPLPFDDSTFDTCFSHMLYCMALTTKEIEFLSKEILRVLKPGGLNIFSVRQTEDDYYKKGIHHGEDMYEMQGFIVHFFSREKVEDMAQGYNIISIDKIEEGKLPRKLFRVVLRRPQV
ncbi:MAG: class I SAM-dependent methyltransferase [Spirochaetia bacterium]|jgi:SAM-dependent methyltransferase|nr:class I SAM-dependent methyltransferase [Spirochaetia bacterium]